MSKINTQEVKDIQTKATAIETELNDLTTTMESIDSDVEAELKGTGATASRIALEKSARNSKLQKVYDARLRDYTTQYNKANNLINQNTEIFKYTQEQNKAKQTAIAGVYMSQYENQQSRDNMQFQADLWLQTKQAEFEQGLAQQAQLASDPVSAVKATLKTFADLWILADRSEAEIIADVQSKVASGIPLGQAISELQTAFKSKPMYKAMVDAQMASLQPKPTTPYELKELGGKTYKFNQATGQYEIISPIPAWNGGDLRYLEDQFQWQAWAKNNNPAWITWNANFDKWTGTAKLFADAGIQFAKWTARPANEWGNYVTFATIEDGLKAQKILMTQTYGNSTVGDMLASWVWTSEWPAYAKQVAWMAGITDLNQKVSALSPEQVSALQMAKIKKESPWLYGILSQPTQPTSQYTDQNIADLAYLVELQDKNPTQASKDMKELGYTARDIANYKAWNVPLTDKQKVTSQWVVDDIKDLVSNYDWNDATGVHFGMPVIAWTDRADTLQKIDQLVAKMTLPNLGSLKWPMSDKDLTFITKASSNLSAELSDVQFEKNLIQAYNVAARRAWLPEVTTLDEIKWNTPVKQTVGGEKAYSKYE